MSIVWLKRSRYPNDDRSAAAASADHFQFHRLKALEIVLRPVTLPVRNTPQIRHRLERPVRSKSKVILQLAFPI